MEGGGRDAGLHVAIVNLVYEARFSQGRDLLDAYETLTGCSSALARAGARVTVFQRFRADEEHRADGVDYRFVSDAFGAWPARWQIPRRLYGKVRESSPDVVHFQGMIFPAQLLALRFMLPDRIALIVQHHGEKPASRPLRWLQSLALSRADALLFAARDLAQPWIASGTIRGSASVFEVMEGSTAFQPRDRDIARASTGLTGNPVVLWIGRIIADKGAFTVLDGFEEALRELPGARLYVIHHEAPLLDAVRARVSANPALNRAVTILGAVPHARIEDYLNASDVFVSGSRHEGSGYALIEAVACGVVPVVTDIEAFRVITDQGRLGTLWPVGDHQAFARALVSTVRTLEPTSHTRAARSHFESKLSFGAIASDTLAAYSKVVASRRGLAEAR